MNANKPQSKISQFLFPLLFPFLLPLVPTFPTNRSLGLNVPLLLLRSQLRHPRQLTARYRHHPSAIPVSSFTNSARTSNQASVHHHPKDRVLLSALEAP
jgi:hypothetical protein